MLEVAARLGCMTQAMSVQMLGSPVSSRAITAPRSAHNTPGTGTWCLLMQREVETRPLTLAPHHISTEYNYPTFRSQAIFFPGVSVDYQLTCMRPG